MINIIAGWIVFKILKKIILYFLAISLLLVLIFKWLPVPITPLMVIRSIQQAKEENRDFRLKKDWESLANINNSLQLAVVCTEDQNFLKHNGFDYDAIMKAIKENEDGVSHRGASTISQQTAKNMFLWPDSHWIRKGFEVYFTFLIETFWSKERIMEVYLNIIEFGDGIYGAEAASQYFFNKNASDLTKNEAAKLAVVLPNPLKYAVKKNARPKKQAWTLRQMRLWGGLLKFE